MRKVLFAIMLLCSLVSCGTSETVVSTGVNLSEYEYCLLGEWKIYSRKSLPLYQKKRHIILHRRGTKC